MLRRIPILLCAIALVAAAPPVARADNALSRGAGRVGGFFRSIGRLFLPTPLDPTLRRALETYAKGDYFTTYLHAAALKAKRDPKLTDEANLLAGLAAADAGLRDEAAIALAAVLEADPPSPYYPVALATLLELDLRLGNAKGAAREAKKYLGGFWMRPSSAHTATVKAIFLESGNISPLSRPRYDPRVNPSERDTRQEDHPAERALYLAGVALLGGKQFETAIDCLESLTPKSVYFVYARYAMGQAYYGLQEVDDAADTLAEVQGFARKSKAELFLKDRAALMAGQLLHEADRNSRAIGSLRNISKTGPYALHAALLAAEIQADEKQPALALVYLQDKPTDSVEPKLAARALALDAELHREMNDVGTAVARLEEGLKGLGAYAAKLDATEASDLDRLVKPVALRQRSRDAVDDWRRQSIGHAIPDLVEGRSGPTWTQRMFTSAVASESDYPIIYYPKPYDPFTALDAPKDVVALPPSDSSFPTIFRRSLGQALAEALHQENALRNALERGDDLHLSLLVLDGELRLRDRGPAAAKAERSRRLAALGLPDKVIAMVGDRSSRQDTLARALKSLQPLEKDAARHEALLEAARAQLELWSETRRDLVREGIKAEGKAVQDIRIALEFQLSEALATKKEGEHKALQGS
jgi:TolA-binding protein